MSAVADAGVEGGLLLMTGAEATHIHATILAVHERGYRRVASCSFWLAGKRSGYLPTQMILAFGIGTEAQQ